MERRSAAAAASLGEAAAAKANQHEASDGAPIRVQRRRTGGRPRGARATSLEQPITRGYVAQVLGVNVSTVRRLETRGQLHPRIGAGGIRYFHLHEILTLKARRIRMTRDRTAEMRLAAFELFRRGIDWRDVAIKLRYDPFRVHRLWRLYALDEGAGADLRE